MDVIAAFMVGVFATMIFVFGVLDVADGRRTDSGIGYGVFQIVLGAVSAAIYLTLVIGGA